MAIDREWFDELYEQMTDANDDTDLVIRLADGTDAGTELEVTNVMFTNGTIEIEVTKPA
jgi:hypothetical protein